MGYEIELTAITDWIIMTDDCPLVDEIESKATFERTMGRVLRAALQNGVDPCGSWVYTADGPGPDLEVMVIELATDAETE